MGPMIEKSGAMKEIYRLIHQIAPFSAAVCFTGESGTGKTYLARLLHQLNPQRSGPFVTINCSSIPQSLMETELFGYEKGAYTGARNEGKIGLIEMAHNGTLFLDEIGDLPPLTQVKLLNVLQEKKFTRIGGTREREVRFRLVTATNKDLIEEIQRGNFRQDLFYRIFVIPIRLPALRERREDILPFIQYYQEKLTREYQVDRVFAPDALQCLAAYDWPGNIRQLQNLVERCLLTADDRVIPYDGLPSFVRHNRRESAVTSAINHSSPGASRSPEGSGPKTLKRMLEDMEKAIILDAYQELKSTTKVAERLGVSQPTVSIKLKRYLNEEV